MPEPSAVGAACEVCTLATTDTPRAAGGFFVNLLSTDGFPPRWQCGDAWTPGHGWLHIISDFAIFGAYFAIPVVLAYFLMRRKDIPFPPILWLFVAFIALCGLGHFIEGTIFWTPWYRLSGLLKGATAVVSWVTVIALIRIVPQALNLPGLALVNTRLESEIAERRVTEEKLQKSNEELQLFTRSVFNREQRMIALKEEINSLLDELGREPRYAIKTADE